MDIKPTQGTAPTQGTTTDASKQAMSLGNSRDSNRSTAGSPGATEFQYREPYGSPYGGTIQPTASGSSLINVGSTERIASVVGGVALLAYCLKNLSLARLPLAVVGGALLHRGATGYCSVNAAVGRNTATSARELAPIEISQRVTINRPREEVFQFWRKLENLPKFMHHLKEVRQVDPVHSHWIAQPQKHMGRLSWDAIIVAEQENERLAWQSVPDALIDNAGEVLFHESQGGRATDVQIKILYRPPAGSAGAVAARFLNPLFSRMIEDDVRRFKQVMESGYAERLASESVGGLIGQGENLERGTPPSDSRSTQVH